MALLRKLLYVFIFTCFLLTGLASSSSFLSYEIFESHKSTGGALLPAKTECQVDFKTKNYTKIKETCKETINPAKQCEALTEFACPFAKEINDMTTDCANKMFDFLDFYGKCPPGLFSNLCYGGVLGLVCPEEEPKVKKSEEPKVKKSEGRQRASHSILITMVAVTVLPLLWELK